MKSKAALRKLTRLADKTNDKAVSKAIAAVSSAVKQSRSTVPTIPDTALERAIKKCVTFSRGKCDAALMSIDAGDTEGARTHIDLASAGFDLINNLAELIS